MEANITGLRLQLAILRNRICLERHGIGSCDFLENCLSSEISLDEKLETLYIIQVESHLLFCNKHDEADINALITKPAGE